jgi:hypothetical protein
MKIKTFTFIEELSQITDQFFDAVFLFPETKVVSAYFWDQFSLETLIIITMIIKISLEILLKIESEMLTEEKENFQLKLIETCFSIQK